MKLYTKEGWIDWKNLFKYIMNKNRSIVFMTGPRGIGKSFGVIKYLIENKIPFIFMRRTQKECDLQRNPQTSDLNKILNTLNINARFESIAKGSVGCIYDSDDRLICECVALSTFASIRGVNFDNFEFAIYDEFIPEPHVRAIKMEGFALQQFYESVNRNRELEGRKPLTMICLSNSLNIANDIFMQFDLIDKVEEMSQPNNNDEIFETSNKMLIIPKHSPISKKKAETVLYQEGSEEFARMAISNKFILNDFSYVKKRNIKEYIIDFQIDKLFVYKHKSNHEYYVSFTKAQTKNKYGSNHNDLERFKREKWRLWIRYLDGYVTFDSYKAVALFEKYFD